MDTDAIDHNGISHLCIEGWNERGVPFIGGMQDLARIFHKHSATSPNSTVSAALNDHLGVLKYR